MAIRRRRYGVDRQTDATNDVATTYVWVLIKRVSPDRDGRLQECEQCNTETPACLRYRASRSAEYGGTRTTMYGEWRQRNYVHSSSASIVPVMGDRATSWHQCPQCTTDRGSSDGTKAPTLKTKAKAKALKSKSKTKTKAVKICLEAASSRGTASRHHITARIQETLRSRSSNPRFLSWFGSLPKCSQLFPNRRSFIYSTLFTKHNGST